MKAKPGDWLIISDHAGSGTRTAEILSVHPGGEPPFGVRWTDNEYESLMFPGSDAEVVTQDELARRQRAATERMSRTQQEIAASRTGN